MPDKKKEEVKEETRLEFLQRRLAEIPKEFDGFSNIPFGHEYWGLRNEYQSLIQSQK